MKSVIKKIRGVFEIDRYVTEERKAETLRTQQIVALIAAVGFATMSIMNIIQTSWLMFITTAGAALLFGLGFILSLITKKAGSLKFIFYVTILLLFPIYAMAGGNGGFAVLWMLLVTYLVMYVVDFKIGAYICLFHAVFLFVLFMTPMKNLIASVSGAWPEGYTDTFMLRFPLLYLVNYAFACYICGTMRVYQYRIIIEQKKYKKISITDVLTDAFNRNAYMMFVTDFKPESVSNGAVIYMDANGLHELNNGHGHAAGDDLLKSVVNAAKEAFPGGDVYRVGGDEFVIFLHDYDEQKIPCRIEEINIELARKNYTVSTGYVSFISGKDTNLTEITAEANRIMLENKALFYQQKNNDRRAR